jgi:hypothetical protein
MLIVAQIPISDSRPFVDPALRLKVPTWPIPNPKTEFVRYFGSIRRRNLSRSGTAETDVYYCGANKAIRICDSSGFLSQFRCAFRRLLCDGINAARVEIGFSNGKQCSFNSDDELILQAQNVLRIRTEVPRPSGGLVFNALGNQNHSLAKLYSHATCSTSLDKVNTNTASKLVRAGDPMLIIERVKGTSNRHGIISVDIGEPANQVGLSFTWILNGQSRVGLWVINTNQNCQSTLQTARSVRLSLLRMHSQRQGLKLLLGLLAQDIIQYKPRTREGDLLEEFLNTATHKINKGKYENIAQDPLRLAMESYDSILSAEDFDLISHHLAGARRQILKKLEALTQINSQHIPGYTIMNGNLTIVQGNMTTSVKIGDGNIVVGDVIAAGIIKESFNAARNGNADEELKKRLEQLVINVGKLTEYLEQENAQKLARNLRIFVDETNQKTPDKSLLNVSGKGLVDASKTVAEMVGPITSTVTAILKFFGLVL